MYTVGEKVAHPMHGAGVIEQILPREEGGKERLFYLLRLCVGSMTLLLPCDSCGAVGLRPHRFPGRSPEPSGQSGGDSRVSGGELEPAL